MTKVALIDKAPNRTDYVAHFKNEFEFDQYHLCSEQTVSYTHLRAHET